jgi:hypothetical protein
MNLQQAITHSSASNTANANLFLSPNPHAVNNNNNNNTGSNISSTPDRKVDKKKPVILDDNKDKKTGRMKFFDD